MRRLLGMISLLTLLTGCGPAVSYTLCSQGVLDCRTKAEKAMEATRTTPPPSR
jgi:hypothetical protein